MTGMYQSRDIISQGTINLGTRGPRTFGRGHIVSGRLVIPPEIGAGAVTCTAFHTELASFTGSYSDFEICISYNRP